MSNRNLLLWAMLWIGGLSPSAFSAEVRPFDPSARANNTALAAQQALRAADQEILMVDGAISKIDAQTGQVEVQTPQGVSILRLAPEAVKALKVGQPAVVELVPRQK